MDPIVQEVVDYVDRCLPRHEIINYQSTNVRVQQG